MSTKPIYFYGSTKRPNGRYESFVRCADAGEPVAVIVSFETHPTRDAAYQYARSMAQAMARNNSGVALAFRQTR